MEVSFYFLSSSCLFLFCILASALLLLFKKPSSPTILQSYPLIGTLPHFIKNCNRVLEWSTELLAASPTATVTVAPMVFTANPSNVEHVLKTNFDNYPKGGSIVSALHDFLGRGIFISNGEQWKVQRKTASFEFNTKSLRAFVLHAVRREAVGRLVPLLRRASRSGEVVDLQDVFERFAFDNICSLVFDQDPSCLLGGNEEGERFFHAFDEAAHLCIDRAKQALPLVWKLKKWLDVGSERRLRESMSTVHEFVDMFIYLKRRRGAGDGGDDDLLSRFVKNGEQSDEFLRDFLISVVLAGRDTTPAAITWFFWELSSRPDVVEAIREELRSIRSKQGEKRTDEVFALEELRGMHYLHAAISESLRLHPAVPLLPRVCERDDKLPDGTKVCKGWTVMYNSYAMGRDEGIWGEDCKEFRPERWLEEGEFQAVSAFRYPVFHAGPRMCLGKDMAVIQMKALTAIILEGFEMELVEERGKHQLSVSMRMEGGLPMRFRERQAGTKAFNLIK
ncbi:cytochrome P450 94A1-like [Phoenix dactylifera]|nr:cytochrome P450 94A1-like [Phoenix dactylifera]